MSFSAGGSGTAHFGPATETAVTEMIAFAGNGATTSDASTALINDDEDVAVHLGTHKLNAHRLDVSVSLDGASMLIWGRLRAGKGYGATVYQKT